MHREKYTFPDPEYKLGLMLILEHFSIYLDKEKEPGVVFGDYEQDEISTALNDFSSFKTDGERPTG